MNLFADFGNRKSEFANFKWQAIRVAQIPEFEVCGSSPDSRSPTYGQGASL
jgi:hypothetical protein